MNKIDLTPLIGTQVLCEFWNDKRDYSLGMLDDIQDENFIKSSNSERGEEFDNCRIYSHPDYWISNADGKLILPDGLQCKGMTNGHAKITGPIINGKLYNAIGGGSLPLGNFEHVQVIDLADGWEY